MTSPSHDSSDAPFDPYRFGRPEQPVPPEFAPPGYYPPPQTLPSGAPTPPPYHAYQQPGAGNGKAIASLVLGLVSIAFFWLSVLDVVPVVLAVVFGILGLTDARSRRIGGRGLAIAGLCCAAVGAVAAIVFTAVVLHAVEECGGIGSRDDPGFSKCVKDHQ